MKRKGSDASMRGKRKFVTKVAAGIMASVMILNMAPGIVNNDLSTVQAAKSKKVQLSAKKLTLKKGTKKKLTLKNAKGKIVWKTSKKSVAAVSKKGVVTAKKKGKAVITATCGKVGYKCTVTVKNVKSSSSGNSGSSSSGTKKPAVVYWTPSGTVYHISRGCSTLSRSRVVYSGSVSQSGRPRACKVCS